MKCKAMVMRFKIGIFSAILFLCIGFVSGSPNHFGVVEAGDNTPSPLLAKSHPVDWWFAFKFNAASFPSCGAGSGEQRTCPFGGSAQSYVFGQQYVFASSESRALTKGGGCIGDTTSDPVGSTFDQVYNGNLYYVIWNDQFYDDPHIQGCSKECGGPWGHSKGMLAWNDAGEGLVLQVTTPSWPGAGNKLFPRKSDGNTLGCVKDDDVKVSQHFFSLKLTKGDVVEILKALKNASVVTDPKNPQVVNNGGPGDIQSLVNALGTKSTGKSMTKIQLSSGVGLISKPSALHVPPWQMVSAALGGVSLRTATWWTNPKIPSTTDATTIKCWDPSLGTPGAVAISTSGQWNGTTFGLKGGPGPNFNHAKIAVSTSGNYHFAIFGDMNQQGTLDGPNCGSSQNGRGGLFYVMDNQVLADGIANLILGDTAAP